MNAYRRAAQTLESLPQDAGIGPTLAKRVHDTLDIDSLEGLETAAWDGRLENVDAEYRRAAAANELPLLTPRRFNPRREAWLPVLRTARGEWHFTALFSNTGRAHELGRTRDWVVLFFYDGDHREAQRTVVTETRGPLEGRRVVRGSEADCAAHYSSLESRPAALSA